MPDGTNPVSNNPNAATAGTTTGLGVLLLWILTNVWPKVSISAEGGAAIAGAISTVVLFLGRNGLAGLLRTIVHGGGKP